MPPYKEMYLSLFRSITHAISILQSAQQETEEMYIKDEGPAMRVFGKGEDKDGEE